MVSAALALSWREACGCYPEQNTVLKLYKVRGKLCGVGAGKGQNTYFWDAGKVKNAIKYFFWGVRDEYKKVRFINKCAVISSIYRAGQHHVWEFCIRIFMAHIPSTVPYRIHPGTQISYILKVTPGNPGPFL